MLTFRNLDLAPDTPLDRWPHEALFTALERGSISDWHRIAARVEERPFGVLATNLAEVLEYADDLPAATILAGILADARDAVANDARRRATAKTREIVTGSGLTQAEFARRAGASQAQLSQWMTGKVIPSAAMLLRLERVTADTGDGNPSGPAR